MELTIGDLLKSEADCNSRIAIKVTDDIKCGQPVLYEPRGTYLIALSNTEHGMVLVQPWNCVIYQDNIDMEAIKSLTVNVADPDGGEPTTTTLTVDILKAQGDQYGIKYTTTEHSAPEE